MDQLAAQPQFALQLPVWVIMHPRLKSKGYLTMTGQAGQSVTPLFTEETLAQRYRDGAPQLNQFILGRASNSGEIDQVISAMERQGFTHAAIDPTTKRGIRFALSELRSLANQWTQDSARTPKIAENS
jgi:hypothetical protein